MQGLADGYFILPYTIGDYLSNDIRTDAISTDHEEFEKAENEARKRNIQFLENAGTRSVESFHRDLGQIIWNQCGMARNEKGLSQALDDLSSLKEEFWKNVKVPGRDNILNPELAKAGRVADLIELGELMVRDALERNESCGGHFREEYQTKEGEAQRDDENCAFVSAWEFKGENETPALNREELKFETVHPTQRSYK